MEPKDTPPVADTAPEWLGVFGEETRAIAAKDPEVVKYKNADEFYRGYQGKTELLGRKGLIIPKDGDAPEVHQKFREALGIPEKPEGYKFMTPDKLHPKIKPTPETETNFKARMHARGIPQAQASALYADYLSEFSTAMAKEDEAFAKAREEGLTKLKNKWGNNLENNIAVARNTTLKLIGEEGYKNLGDFANNPVAVELLYKMASGLSEDSIKSLGAATETGAAGDKQKLKEMMTYDAKSPLWNENHPDHLAAVEEKNRLYQKVYGVKNG